MTQSEPEFEGECAFGCAIPLFVLTRQGSAARGPSAQITIWKPGWRDGQGQLDLFSASSAFLLGRLSRPCSGSAGRGAESGRWKIVVLRQLRRCCWCLNCDIGTGAPRLLELSKRTLARKVPGPRYLQIIAFLLFRLRSVKRRTEGMIYPEPHAYCVFYRPEGCRACSRCLVPSAALY